MEKTLKVLNEMEKKGVIERYAIGGGMAVLFYAEPVVTFDLDIFCLLPAVGKAGIISLSPLYEYLKGKGYKVEKEHVLIEGLPVQFIPAYNELVEEAVKDAVEAKYHGTRIKIVRLEHLMAIMVQTNRPKDRERLLSLIAETRPNTRLLEKILSEHGLKEKWNAFKKRR